MVPASDIVCHHSLQSGGAYLAARHPIYNPSHRLSLDRSHQMRCRSVARPTHPAPPMGRRPVDSTMMYWREGGPPYGKQTHGPASSTKTEGKQRATLRADTHTRRLCPHHRIYSLQLVSRRRALGAYSTVATRFGARSDKVLPDGRRCICPPSATQKLILP